MADQTPAVFDSAALQKRIAETVQSTFGMLIPPERFATMVEKEVKAYFESEEKFLVEEVVTSTNSWGHESRTKQIQAKMTPFRRQVWEALSEQIKIHLRTVLDDKRLAAIVTTDYNTNATSVELSTMLEAKLNEIAPKMAASMFRDMFAGAVLAAKDSVLCEVNERIRK